MSTLLAFAGSNSSTSINHELVTYLTTQLKDSTFELFKLSHMDLIVYSEDEQRDNGFPSSINQVYKHIQASTGIIISVNEHNSNPFLIRTSPGLDEPTLNEAIDLDGSHPVSEA